MKTATATKRPEYHFVDGSRLPEEKAQAIGEHLHALEMERGSQITPDVVLHDAERPSSPLHSLFTWDDTEAARLWRLEQAGLLLRSIQVRFFDIGREPQLVRAYHVVHKTPDEPRTYMPVQTIMADAGLRAQLLDRALGEARSWQNRYQHLHELAGVFDALDKATAYGRNKKDR